jgi:hypothetical protein
LEFKLVDSVRVFTTNSYLIKSKAQLAEAEANLEESKVQLAVAEGNIEESKQLPSVREIAEETSSLFVPDDDPRLAWPDDKRLAELKANVAGILKTLAALEAQEVELLDELTDASTVQPQEFE